MSNIRDSLRLSGECQEWDDADIEPYIPVFDAVNIEALLAVAQKTRSAFEPDAKSSCSIDYNILGSYNIMSVIRFSDGLRWAAKIPRYGIASTFGRLNQQKMLSEILTLRLIRSRTSLPVPDIFDWDVTSRKIGVPYILMSFLPGTTLDERWTDQRWMPEERRVALLRNLAKLMSELHALQFDKIGYLFFDDKGDFVKVDQLIAQTEGDIFHPQYDVIGGHQTIRWPEPTVLGPFDSAKSFLLSGVVALEAEQGLSALAKKQRKADVAVLRLAIDSIPEHLTERDDSFVLAHPTLDAPNILVDDNGKITGLIDWDSVQTMPRAYGFSSYPSWITRDWDPIMYENSDPELEDSPDTLSRYRQIYASAFEGLELPPNNYIPDETRLSHIYEAIFVAASSFWNLSPIDKLLEHAFRGATAEPFNVEQFRTELANELETGIANERLARIEEAFRKMWYPEWEFGLAL
ncbi:kinase-like domain-containing protein [Sphaerosporella brunnea]|uniref:Kinase-like domain-containing protein n=1 Tax=Sphaerosporella brunnea TaxID=1250544 RepID=A0A5J5FAL9_9PEZI|nr:kinase-like domain-containing protein [Sphaerosporella brunnea]